MAILQRKPWILALILAAFISALAIIVWQGTAAEAERREQLLGEISALELRATSASPNPAGDGSLDYRFEMVFTTIPTSYTDLEIRILPTDGALTIRTKKTDAVQEYASAYGLNIPRARIILIGTERGL